MRAIWDAINRSGLAHVWRNNSGVATTEAGSTMRFGIGVGGADLVGFAGAAARFFACEVKTPRGRVSDDQRLWLAFVNARGGYACVARSVDEALEHARRAAAGDKP